MIFLKDIIYHFQNLQPDTEYIFEIHADNACEITSIKTVKFKTPGTIFEIVELSEEEKAKQLNLIKNIPEEVKQEFNAKYEAWKETWDDPNLIIYSNPGMYTQSRQYEEFLSFCKEQGKGIWPLLFQKYELSDYLVKETLIDLTILNTVSSWMKSGRKAPWYGTLPKAHTLPHQRMQI
jgi:hypothetical protein